MGLARIRPSILTDPCPTWELRVNLLSSALPPQEEEVEETAQNKGQANSSEDSCQNRNVAFLVPGSPLARCRDLHLELEDKGDAAVAFECQVGGNSNF